MTEKGPSIPRQLLAKPGMQIFLFICTLVYVISPIDIIPDVVPIIGWLDDAAVFMAQIASFIIYLKETRRRQTEKTTQQNEGK
ncbi:MAG TPA: hypothetical protein DCG57_20225 [Candidatus Riflebacteria bacterium]|jgi:uncharacterized membrane protein YkvA (DUF1232 family)|nr:MAG: hypothetical protein CVV41_10010 [Candidatus Riflebacteria bacterium HGW-Riflebacteria-1]HAE40934.1 hypothetical protein [Candidatus Riflebacteria bacterium]